MAFELSRPSVFICHRNLVATSDRAPTIRLARADVAAAEGGFGPAGTGGVAALRGSGVQRPAVPAHRMALGYPSSEAAQHRPARCAAGSSPSSTRCRSHRLTPYLPET